MSCKIARHSSKRPWQIAKVSLYVLLHTMMWILYFIIYPILYFCFHATHNTLYFLKSSKVTMSSLKVNKQPCIPCMPVPEDVSRGCGESGAWSLELGAGMGRTSISVSYRPSPTSSVISTPFSLSCSLLSSSPFFS